METIPFALPYIGREEEEAVLAVLRSGWLTTGKETLAFENEFAAFLSNGISDGTSGGNDGAPLYCMAVNSATSGLHLALEACGVKQSDLVLLPSMTFTATAEVIRYLGGEAVFVDVAKDGFHIDGAALEEAIEKLGPERRGKAVAVMPVHYGGLPCNMDDILAIAEKYGLKVIEDAAHSFPSLMGSGYRGQGTGNREQRTRESDPLSPVPRPSSLAYAGTIGDIGVFSFYATKTITTGEGGMVVTRDKALADRMKIMRSHGIDRSVWNRYTDTKASWYYEVIEPGFKYNIPDILSALGRAQLRRANELLLMRQEIARLYDEAFGGDCHFTLPPTGDGDARHLYPLLLNLDTLSVSRNEFAVKVQEQGVGISVHFIPLHTMPYYKKRYALNDGDFPETMRTYNRCLSLPIWPGMTGAQIDRVITVVKDTAKRNEKAAGSK